MNLAKKILFSVVFLLIFITPVHSQYIPEGTELCDNVFNILKYKGLEPAAQNLVPNVNNSFPYNIILSNKNNNDSSENLIFIFKMEEIWKYKDILLATADKLKTETFNSTILISYTEDSFSPIEFNIKGSEIFLNSLNTNDNNYVFLINLTADHNEFITGSKGITSPAWMIQNTFSAYTKEKLNKDIPFYYLSQISKYKFLDIEPLAFFLTNNIPAIELNFKTEYQTTYESISTIKNVILDVIDNYITNESRINDYHSLMIRMFKKTLWFSEYSIVQSIIIIIFIVLLFTFIISFINANLRNQAWKKIKTNWHVLPSTLALTILGFFGSKYFYIFLSKVTGFHHSAFGIVVFQIILSSILVSIFYLLELFYLKNYGERSIDFLIFITTVINLILFTIVDISLFPIFLTIAFFAFISLVFRNNITHILLFIFMLITFIPYVFYLYNYCDSETLSNFLTTDNFTCIFIPLILLPIHLMLLRIYTATKKHFTKKWVFIVIVSSTFILISLFFYLMNQIFLSDKSTNTTEITLIENKDKKAEISYSDRIVFGEIIRYVTIECDDNPTYIEFVIFADEVNPVLYSDNKYQNLSWNTVQFSIPKNPPEKLNFSYGAEKSNSILQIKVYYQEPNTNVYSVSEHSLFIEES